MSRRSELREEANREPDPEIRRQRDLKAGRRRFFSWTEFVLGLGVVAALVGCFYYELSSGMTMVVVGVVALVIAGIQFRRVKARLRNLEKSG